MMEHKHLTVIQGGKGVRESYTPQFSVAYVTNTRLMGVVAVKALELTSSGAAVAHFFHLDFEEFGIDAYERIESMNPETLDRITRKMTGGLGGELVEISAEEMAWLIREAYALNLSFSEPLPEGMDSLFSFLKAQSQLESRDIHGLWLKMTPELISDTELINYYLMRLWAGDAAGAQFLSRSGAVIQTLSEWPGVMVRNRIQFLRDAGGVRYYQAEALSDNEKEYKIAACEIGVFEESGQRRIFSITVQSAFKVSEVEAAFMLRRKEYLGIYTVLDPDRVRLFFDLYKPDAMITVYEEGLLYSYFKTHNKHVQSDEYYLNEDVQCYYYLSEDQLIVCALDPRFLREAQIELELSEMTTLLQYEAEHISENPILYDFISSDYLDFQEFWEDYNT